MPHRWQASGRSVSLSDERGAASDPFVLSVDLNGTGATVGTTGDDRLVGQPLMRTRSSALRATTSCSAIPAMTCWTVVRAMTS